MSIDHGPEQRATNDILPPAAQRTPVVDRRRFLSNAMQAAALFALSGHDTEPDPEPPESYPVAPSMIDADLYMPLENGDNLSYKIKRLDNSELLLRAGKHTYRNDNVIGMWPLQTEITKHITDIHESTDGIHFSTAYGVAILSRNIFMWILKTLAYESPPFAKFYVQLDVRFKEESKKFMEDVLAKAGVDPYGVHKAIFERVEEQPQEPLV